MPPIDLGSASREIDTMIWEGLKSANTDIKSRQEELRADREMDPVEKEKEMAPAPAQGGDDSSYEAAQ